MKKTLSIAENICKGAGTKFNTGEVNGNGGTF